MTKKSKVIAIIALLCALGCVAAIFAFSSKPAVVSKEQSGAITRMIMEFVHRIDSGLTFSQIDHIVRKCAHFIEFMLLGACVFAFARCVKRSSPLPVAALSWLFCILYAISDEIHQIFVAGRGCRFEDVVLDSFGSLAGILAVLLITLIVRRK